MLRIWTLDRRHLDGHAVTLEAQAREALRCGDLQGAAAAAKDLAQSELDQPAGYFLLGMIAAEAGQVAKSIP